MGKPKGVVNDEITVPSCQSGSPTRQARGGLEAVWFVGRSSTISFTHGQAQGGRKMNEVRSLAVNLVHPRDKLAGVWRRCGVSRAGAALR